MKRRAQPWLGTLVEISIADAFCEPKLNQAFAQAFAQIAEVHRLMSFHSPHSDVARINAAAAGCAVTISPHTMSVLQIALQLTDATASVFNINCGSQLARWAMLPSTDANLPPYAGDECSLHILDATTVRKTRPALIDLGGIAKGYAVDQAVAALEKNGIASACVNAGGDLRVLGDLPFPITIRDPQALGQAGAQLDLSNAALATSATYFSRRKFGGKTVSALIDGRNGAAIMSERSVSVIAPSCILADALTKVVLASGDPNHAILADFNATAFMI